MSAYTLYYWPIPFRGQFIRAVLAHVGVEWVEADMDAIIDLKNALQADQPVPLMAPPVLVDHETGVGMAQMPAILTYLGDKHGLFPDDLAGAALTQKIIADANDVLYEMTRHNGAQMWDQQTWDAFKPRLARWMVIFEDTGRRHGLTAEEGFLLATAQPGLADLVSTTLWGTMTAKLPTLRPMLDETAPRLAGLVDRIAALPAQEALRARSDEAWGDLWCEGQIEASLRAVL